MNKSFLQSSSWSSMNNQAPISSSSSSLAMSLWHDEQDLLPVSWSQLLLGGSLTSDFQTKKLVDDEEVGNWEDQMVACDASEAAATAESGYEYGSGEIKQLAEAAARASLCQMNSTTFGSNMLDFSNSKAEKRRLDRPPPLDHSSECNIKETGGAAKKIKVAQSTFKVRKEKLGDRIAVLHQLVSPFGKTDTASVLLEAIGYIRFLQNQIEALSSPYLGSGGSDCTRQPAVKKRNCIFPEDPGQVDGGELKDLRSLGLCLVPLSTCTSHVGVDTGADHWAASIAAGFP